MTVPAIPGRLRRICAPGALGLLVSALLAAVVPATAQSLVGPDRTEWSALTLAQRSALAPLQRDWSAISPAQQQKWIELANRKHTLPPDEQARVSQRMTEWARLSPQERARARLNFQEARQLSTEDRQQQWESYRALPADQRRALAESAQRSTAQKPKTPPEPLNPAKSNVVRGTTAPVTAPRPVGPTVVQRGAGATTNLVSKPPAPPLHQQAGLPKVAATPEFVDKATLLPQRGAQGAAVAPKSDKAGVAR